MIMVGNFTPPKSLYTLYHASAGISPRTSLSIQVRTRSTMFCSLMYPTTLYLFCSVNVTVLYFVPSIVSAFAVALLAMAPLRKPKGVSQKPNWVSHGAPDEMYWFWVWSAPACTRTSCTWEAVALRSISRLYDFTLTTGQAALGLTFWPMPALEPMPVN